MIMFRRLAQTCWTGSRLAARFCHEQSAANPAREDSITLLMNNPTFLAESAVAGFREFENYVRRRPHQTLGSFGNPVPANLMKIFAQLTKTRLSILPNSHKFVTLALNLRGPQTDEMATDMLKSLLSNQENWSIESAGNFLSVLYQLLSFGVMSSKEMNAGSFDENLTRTITAGKAALTRFQSIRLALKINQVNELLAENGFRELTGSFKEISTIVPSNLISKVLAAPDSADFEELVELLELAHYGLNDVSNTQGLLEAIEARIDAEPDLVGFLEVDHIVKVAFS